MLKDNGYLYIGVPNFRNNPADIYTYDHLSRFTPSVIKQLFSSSGFDVAAEWVLKNRVPMWFMHKG